MEERLVDIVGRNGQVLHTYPVTLGGQQGSREDHEFLAKALEAAAHGQLVPDSDLAGLSARMHQSRGGRLQPSGDKIGTMSETKLGLEQLVRERAYGLWEQEGRPDGSADEFWHRALDEHLRGRAYVLWQQEGSPEGAADADWNQTRKFESR